MNSLAVGLYRCCVGPKLYRRYASPNYPQETASYRLSSLENICSSYISFVSMLGSGLISAWPLSVIFCLTTGATHLGQANVLGKSIKFGLVFVVAFVCRGASRLANPLYVEFISKYLENREEKELREMLKTYDFSIRKYPAQYNSTALPELKNRPESTFILAPVVSAIKQVIALWIIHPIAITITYPGTILSLFQDATLQSGRALIQRRHNACRNLVQTSDGNNIDTMFVDRRPSGGNKLIICCEGNGSYYEVGVFQSTCEMHGYSVLGYNRPGFGESTGRISEYSERCASLAVIDFAENSLGFERKDIIVYGWSIGGFSALIMATSKKEPLHKLIIDASFEHVKSLAGMIVPVASGLTNWFMENYIDLDNSSLIKRYDGSILLVRRTMDEIVTTTPGQLPGNRSNFLLIEMLKHRYPTLFNQDTLGLVKTYLEVQPIVKADYLKEFQTNHPGVKAAVNDHLQHILPFWPIELTKIRIVNERKYAALLLVNYYQKDVDKYHCEQISMADLISQN